MPTISGWTVNHNGSRRWPNSRVFLIDESNGELADETTSDGVGFFYFTVADTVTVYTIVADSDAVRAGARSGIVGVA